ncbi:MAG: peptide MFS transporter [Planctomycetia bacterium]|nr:peptide MFS transporter [Planctomycetia bacterium]
MREQASAIRPQDRVFLGHPIGLWVLFTTEMWERFCYYGMRAFLVMYLFFSVSSSNPGFGWSEKEAYELYGWFTGLVYLLPLFGGYLADRFIGQHRSVLYGGILIALGEFALFLTEFFRTQGATSVTLSSSPGAWLMFMGGLTLITIGTGFFKPCISVMVGQLYSKKDKRRDVAFTIFYMGINVGAFFAPLVAGTIAEKIGWHWGFLTAAIGMVFGLITYSLFRPKYLGHIGMRLTAQEAESELTEEEKIEKANMDFERTRALNRRDIDRIGVILVLSLFCVAFWSVFEQAGSSLSTFAKKETNRTVPHVLVSSKGSVFLANEDETDALLSLAATRRNLAAATKAFDELTEATRATESTNTRYAPRPGLVDTAIAYDQASRRVEETFALAEWSSRKAAESRKKAGLSPKDIVIPSRDTLLAEGTRELDELDARAEKEIQDRYSNLFDTSHLTSDEAKAELQAQRDAFKRGLISDFERVARSEFDKERKASADPADSVYSFPASWYQSVNPLLIVFLAPLFAGLWSFLGKRNLEPSTPVKFGIGLILLSIAFMFMVAGGAQAERTGGNAAAYWLLFTYLFCTLGELCLSPVGLSMVSRLAPVRYVSLLMGAWFLSSSVACYLSGKLVALFGAGGSDGGGRIYFCFGPECGLADYFLLMALMPMLAGVIVFAISPILRRLMHEES